MAVPVHMEMEDEEFEEEQESETPEYLVKLVTAAETGDADLLRQAVAELNGSIDGTDEDGDTALHLACLYGHLDCVKILVEAGASIYVKDEDGAVPLHDACAGGYIDIVKLLLATAEKDEGKLKEILETADSDGDTPLHNAARGSHPNVAQELLKYGAALNVQNAQFKTPAELADDDATRQILENAVGQ